MEKEKTNEAVLEYMIINGKDMKTSDLNPVDLMRGDTIYEVIRLKDKSALYFEEHIERMRKSANIINVDFEIGDDRIKEEIKRLASLNGEENINVKLMATNFKDGSFDFAVYFIKSFYPPEQMYREGIHVITYKTERKNPHAKIMNKGQRDRINRKREQEGAFEAILVNEKGKVTEGSRSNLFFVKGSKVHTPSSGDVLLGITRKKVLEICAKNDIEIVERMIDASEISGFEGAFITGTSINVLPISTIDDMDMNSVSNEVISLLVDEMRNDVADYIDNHKL